jgi:opacity protein-like surface antigen
MKKLFVLSFVVILCISGFAQTARNIEIYLNSGVSIPSAPEEFTEYWSTGFNAGGGVGYKFSNMVIGVAYFDYNSFTFDEDEFLQDIGAGGTGAQIEGGAASLISFQGNVKLYLVQNIRSVFPYLRAGFGFMNLSTDDVSVFFAGVRNSYEGDSESAFAVNFGAGLDVSLSPTIKLFFEGGYNLAFTENESTGYIPVKAGVGILL